MKKKKKTFDAFDSDVVLFLFIFVIIGSFVWHDRSMCAFVFGTWECSVLATFRIHVIVLKQPHFILSLATYSLFTSLLSSGLRFFFSSPRIWNFSINFPSNWHMMCVCVCASCFSLLLCCYKHVMLAIRSPAQLCFWCFCRFAGARARCDETNEIDQKWKKKTILHSSSAMAVHHFRLYFRLNSFLHRLWFVEKNSLCCLKNLFRL